MWPLPPHGKWTIANIRKEKGDAAAKMLEWFDEAERSKERIPDKYPLLLQMLAINPSHRVTSSELVKNLRFSKRLCLVTGDKAFCFYDPVLSSFSIMISSNLSSSFSSPSSVTEGPTLLKNFLSNSAG